MNQDTQNEILILLVEDNLGDIRLTREALKEGNVRNQLVVVNDGVEAMSYLRKEGINKDALRPDIILLDLNMPRMNGMEVLAEIKNDESLRRIPVNILTTSDSEKDVSASYEHFSNSYITKPVEFDDFINIIQSVSDFWLRIVRLPKNTEI